MAVSHGQRLRRQLVKILEDKGSKAGEKLEAARILADMLKSGIGEKRRAKKKTPGAAGASLLG